MNLLTFLYWLSIILSDKVTFPLFELSLAIIFLYGLLQEYIKRNSLLIVKRGQSSNKIITSIASIVTTFVSIQIVDSTDMWKDYRVVLILLNSFMSGYLFFYNNWFRNKIVGWWIRYDNKEEKH